MAAADLEACVAHVEQRLLALGQALGEPDAGRLEAEAAALQRALAAAVDRLRRPAGATELSAPLRLRLAHAGAQVAAQRESLARATAALDRAIDVLLPASAARAAYDAGGQAERQARGDSTHA